MDDANTDISFLTNCWPGKTINGENHPALWHMLDVAAVAEQLIVHRRLSGKKNDRSSIALPCGFA